MSTKCEKCGIENESDAKFCVSCGEPLVEKVRIQSQLNMVLSFIVFVSICVPLAMIQDLFSMIFLKDNIMTPSEIGLSRGFASILFLYLGFKIVSIINKSKNKKTRITVRVLIIAFAFMLSYIKSI